MKAGDKNYIYKEDGLKVVHNHAATNRTKRLSTLFLVFIAMLFFATSRGGITGAAVAETNVEFTFFPVAMGFISLIAAFLVYALIEK